MKLRVAFLPLLSLLLLACGPHEEPSEPPVFREIVAHPGAALMAVHGTNENDVWMVGADDGSGPLVLHYDGAQWDHLGTDIVGDLWWVQALSSDDVFFAGSDANLYRYHDESWSRLETPGLGKDIIFGIWAAAPDDVYAVGAEAGRNGFIWHWDGDSFSELEVPSELERSNHDVPPLFKVAGRGSDDVWIVGGDGAVLRGSAKSGFQVVDSPTRDRLFTVHLNQSEAVIVGGGSQGIILRADLGQDEIELEDVTQRGTPLLQGAWVQSAQEVWVTGRDGTLLSGSSDSFAEHPLPGDFNVESLHAVWEDPKGGVWAVGGNVISGTLDDGKALYSRDGVPEWILTPEDITPDTRCPKGAVDLAPKGSIARQFNEQLLNAIRRDVPRPTVHARNLLHTSIAMWDAWAAYDGRAQGVVYNEKEEAQDIEAAREEAIAYAAYRVLSHRYHDAVGGAVSQSCFDDFMDVLDLDPEDDAEAGDYPRAVGNRIGRAVIEAFADDGANETHDYRDPDEYAPDHPPLIVDESGVVTDEPTEWQQILLAEAVTQNGISEGAGVRKYVGAHWREVQPFAMSRPEGESTYFQPDMVPDELNADLIDAAVEVLRKTAELDIEDGVEIDISPASYGNNSLGKNDGTGYSENPKTKKPYDPQKVLRGDFTRVLAEFWADGPTSETPPGHWNTIANYLADHPDHEARLFGEGDELDSLSWDVHIYLALNGALHDAAIAAWELKRHHTSARPITLIRYLSELGQSSDPDGPSYDPNGLPLVDDLIEIISEESSAEGERHHHLRRYQGEVAVRSWRGEPGDRENHIGGIDWVRGVDWIPYQRRTFVTPAFPGYVSGHSTFSRAAAEALTQLTGDPYFPGGLGFYRLEPGYLVFEYGPSSPIELQWATFYDAADQAGQSRLWGGIHIRHDDYDGRIIGSEIGQLAVDYSRSFFGD